MKKLDLQAASVEDIMSSFEGLSLNTSRSASILFKSSGSRLQNKPNKYLSIINN